MLENSFEILARDGIKLHIQSWIPEDEIIAVLCILHGLGGHIGRYESFSTYLVEKGYAVFGMDLRGHGKSEGIRGYAKSAEILMSDINDLVIEARRAFIDLPIFIFGHSMGGLLAANYILKNRSRELSGAILLSPLFRLAFKPPFRKMLMGKIFGRIFPSFTLSYEINPLQLSTAYEKMEITHQDSLVHHHLSYSLYKFCLSGGEWAIHNASLNIIPVLVCHGTADSITSHEASQEFSKNAGKEVTCQLWEGMKHELLNETNKTAVYEFINHWISGVLTDG